MLNLNVFAERLKKARNNKGFTQEQLADKIGVSTATICNYERINRKDGKIPTLEKVFALSEILEVSIDWLCGNDNEKNSNINHITNEKFLRYVTMLLYDGRCGYIFDEVANVVTLDIQYGIMPYCINQIKSVIELYNNKALPKELCDICIENLISEYLREEREDDYPF